MGSITLPYPPRLPPLPLLCCRASEKKGRETPAPLKKGLIINMLREEQFLPTEKQEVFTSYAGKSPGQAGPVTTHATAITRHGRERKEPNTEVTEMRANKPVQSKPFLRELIKLGSQRRSGGFFLTPRQEQETEPVISLLHLVIWSGESVVRRSS